MDLPSKNLLVISCSWGQMDFRTVAGTERIGDVELGTISRPVQRRFKVLQTLMNLTSVVVPDKTQYRIFFSNANRYVQLRQV